MIRIKFLVIPDRSLRAFALPAALYLKDFRT